MRSKSKEKNTKKNTKKRDNIFTIILAICDTIAFVILFLLYGPYNGFRDWLVTTAMSTMNHQYFATTFYNDKTIEKVLARHSIVEPDGNTNTELIMGDKKKYIDEYDKEILDRRKNDTYKLIEINEKGFSGYLVAIYDPSKIKVTYSKNLGTSGEYLVDMAKREKAVVAINGGGFLDQNGLGTGGQAIGAIISNGKIISNYGRSQYGGGIVGFTKDNKLYLGKISTEEAINIGIRDAVEFGPFLIVNGKSAFINGNGGYGTHPRSAIAQRQDGIVLFLVIDGRSIKSKGADMNDLVDILLRYHAYNASNLDGGNSSALVIDNKIINHPINWDNLEKTRPIPSGFIVKE